MPRPDDPREWLNRARSNLARAKMRAPEIYLEDLCLDAQQAAEKAIKALLIEKRVRFPHIHDLAGLLTVLGQSGESFPDAVKEASRLTRYAVINRYPGVTEPVTEDEYRGALDIAETVVAWVQERLAEG